MIQSMSIQLPIPPSCLNPNTAAHYQAKARARAQQRADAGTYASGQFRGPGPKWDKVRIKLAWFAKDDNRIPDFDNAIASIKGVFDGLQDAGVVINDRGVQGVDLDRSIDKARPRIEVTVTPIVEAALSALPAITALRENQK